MLGTVADMQVAEGNFVTENQVLFQVVAEETNVSGTGSDTAVLNALREQRAILEEQVSNEAARAQAEMRRLNSLILGLRDRLTLSLTSANWRPTEWPQRRLCSRALRHMQRAAPSPDSSCSIVSRPCSLSRKTLQL